MPPHFALNFERGAELSAALRPLSVFALDSSSILLNT
jgi:hypothetical protein